METGDITTQANLRRGRQLVRLSKEELEEQKISSQLEQLSMSQDWKNDGLSDSDYTASVSSCSNEE
jgi:hypothetical protein